MLTTKPEHGSRCPEDGGPCGSVVLWAAGRWVLASGPGDCDSGSHANQTPCADRATKTSPVSSPSRKRNSGMSTEVVAVRTVASNRQKRFWPVGQSVPVRPLTGPVWPLAGPPPTPSVTNQREGLRRPHEPTSSSLRAAVVASVIPARRKLSSGRRRGLVRRRRRSHQRP